MIDMLGQFVTMLNAMDDLPRRAMMDLCPFVFDLIDATVRYAVWEDGSIETLTP